MTVGIDCFKNRFSFIPRPSQRIPNGTNDNGASEVSDEVPAEVVEQQPEPELRRSNRVRTPKSFGPEFQLYLIEGTRSEVSDQYSYCFIVEDDTKTFEEAMKSQDVAFWKEAINDEMDSIMGNNTYVLTDLPPGCTPLGCKWIFKKKMKVDGTVEKFKARLVIQGFKQKSGIDYFDTYAPVARISTIRLLIALASIHNLIIHQMDVKTAFLNGDLDEERYSCNPGIGSNSFYWKVIPRFQVNIRYFIDYLNPNLGTQKHKTTNNNEGCHPKQTLFNLWYAMRP
ncbi:zinc finger, CCHC-type [Artemisia annua]|uniref:Zinc finger, CCHC-type n=1 Tax=Artemisia annua TaxID=35608 RepID=A0A2U1LG90_ARTAN|nr:zinc finger, CCHC-type [Artemisia annua]